MKKYMIIIMLLCSMCFGDTFTSHLKPTSDNTLDIGTTDLLWKTIYADKLTDNTAVWENSNLSGFTSISGTTLTDTVLSITGGSISSAVNGTFSGTLTAGTLTDGTATITGGVGTGFSSITSTTFVGDLTGNASTATLASTVTVVDSTDATSFIAMFDSATGSLAAKTDGGLTYDASTGDLTVGNDASITGNTDTDTLKILSPNTDGYILRDNEISNVLAWQQLKSAAQARWGFYAADGDGTDNVFLDLYAVGTPDSRVDEERLLIGWNTIPQQYMIITGARNAGVHHDIVLEADGDGTFDQFVCHTDGTVSMRTDLDVGNDATVDGSLTVVGFIDADRIFAGDGTTGGPSYSNTGDANTGMWFSAANKINFSTTGIERLEIDSTGATFAVGIRVTGITKLGDGGITNFSQFSATGDFTQAGSAITTIDQLYLNETTTPTPVADDGAIYTKSTNELFFQDGDGVEHLLHGDAFSNIWVHFLTSSPVAISTQDAYTLIDSFAVVGNEDDMANVVGNTTTNTLTLSSIAGGEYQVSYHGSVTATGGADKEMSFALGITLATPKDITNVTDDTVTPIVITSAGHGLENGDMVQIVGVLGNTAAVGSFIVDSKATDTFVIVALDGGATTGNGDYNEGSPTGDITIEYPGNMEVHRMVRGADFGSISATGLHILSGSDVLGIYVANLSGVTDLTVSAISFSVFRIGD